MDYDIMLGGNSVNEPHKEENMARRRYQAPRPKLDRGVWSIRVREDVAGPDGRRTRRQRRVTLGTKLELPTEKLARRAAEPLLAKINSVCVRPRTVIKFSEFCEKWKLSVLP